MNIKSLFVLLFISTAAKAQITQFHFQPNVLNPATSGFFNKLSVSGMGFKLSNGPSFQNNSSLNYNQKIDVLKGGIGVTFNYSRFGDLVRSSNINLNYSYHLVEKEKFRLALGTGFSLLNELILVENLNGVYYKNTSPFLNIGSVAQFGNHTGQISFRNINFGDAQGRLALNLIYNYDWTINDNFSLKIGANFYNQNSYNTFTLSTITKYKMVWVNLALTNGDSFSTGAGVDFKEKLRAGLYLDFFTYGFDSNYYSNIGIFLAYRIKNNVEGKIIE